MEPERVNHQIPIRIPHDEECSSILVVFSDDGQLMDACDGSFPPVGIDEGYQPISLDRSREIGGTRRWATT